jgi:hypothetical protein
MLTTPPVKKIDLHFPLGLEVTARNLKGVTIKDALDAIYKQYKKKVSLPIAYALRIILQHQPCAALHMTWQANERTYRPTTSWTTLSLPASNGIRRSPGPA